MSGMITFSCDLTLARLSLLIASIYSDKPDDFVICLGDWRPSHLAGQVPAFRDALQVTLGDFRRWNAKASGEAST